MYNHPHLSEFKIGELKRATMMLWSTFRYPFLIWSIDPLAFKFNC